jgi:hypothetical protein
MARVQSKAVKLDLSFLVLEHNVTKDLKTGYGELNQLDLHIVLHGKSYLVDYLRQSLKENTRILQLQGCQVTNDIQS